MELGRSISFLKDYIKCPICYEEFSNRHRPMIIPCGHTICHVCVENLKKMSIDEENEDEEEYHSSFESEDEDFDISLEEEEEEDESQQNEEENEDESEESSEEDDDDDNIYSNSILVENVETPQLEDILLDKDKINTNINLISKQKIKLKCSICRKKMKILDCEIIYNQNVIEIINSYNESVGSIQTTKRNKIFCKLCRCVYIDTQHLVRHASHEPFFIILDSEVFTKIKNQFEIYRNAKSNENVSVISDPELKEKVLQCISLFYEELIKSDEFLKFSNDYMRNYFHVNSKAHYLKHKSHGKLLTLYSKFGTVLEEFQSTNNPELKKNAEDILMNTSLLLRKYSNVIDTYINNFKLILNSEDVTQDKIINENNISFDYFMETIFLNKIVKLLEIGLFESYFDDTMSSERRYAVTVFRESNIIIVYDMRVENKMELDYSIIFQDYPLEDFEHELEEKFSENIEIDEEGRNLYILGSVSLELKSFYCYDMNLRKLYKKKDIPVKFATIDRYYKNNKLFVLGGAKLSSVPILDCFYYDVKADWWVDLPKLKFSRHSKSILFNDDKFYVFGGICKMANSNDNFSSFVNKIEVLNLRKIELVTFDWEVLTIKNMNLLEGNYFSGFLKKDRIVIFGGRDDFEESFKGIIIKLSETDDGEVIGDFKLKNRQMINSNNVCSNYKGMIVGSENGEGYFGDLNLRENLSKINTIM